MRAFDYEGFTFSAQDDSGEKILNVLLCRKENGMKTPICDFVRNYSESNTIRMHMPGHKGRSFLGVENLDITEIKGADSLYEAAGIISESERNAASLFGCNTFYSTEGSSLCIRAMLYLVTLYANEQGKKNIIYAGRNSHKAFINTAALLDFDVKWLSSIKNGSYLSFSVTPESLDNTLKNAKEMPAAVYITSPDYLGNTADIKGFADICHKHNVLLLVDNAHGAYLRFLSNSIHPIDLGADICCDSAHKTLPVLTGGAYLHISKNTPFFFANNAKKALSLFGSTSPSYLILQSIDKANAYLDDIYAERLSDTVKKISLLRQKLLKKGYTLIGNEPLKLTFKTKKYGYLGNDFAELLRKNNIECEFSDPDYVVLMLTLQTNEYELKVLEKCLLSIEQKQEINISPPIYFVPEKVMSIREATMSACETLNAKDSLGRVLAFAQVSCPPAVPIVVSGELIDENAIKCFEYYGINKCCVVK